MDMLSPNSRDTSSNQQQFHGKVATRECCRNLLCMENSNNDKENQNSLSSCSVDVQVFFIIDCNPSIQTFNLIRHRSTHPARPPDTTSSCVQIDGRTDRRWIDGWTDRQMEAWHGWMYRCPENCARAETERRRNCTHLG